MYKIFILYINIKKIEKTFATNESFLGIFEKKIWENPKIDPNSQILIVGQ